MTNGLKQMHVIKTDSNATIMLVKHHTNERLKGSILVVYEDILARVNNARSKRS